MELPKNIIEKLEYFYNSNQIPNIIFHGSSGTGKTTIVHYFLNKIYNSDKTKIKSNVMSVNCSHGKGIKFIREDLKFFAKANLQSTTGVKFKTIVLYNADSLTNDAQSALRRCIEQFSFNTRFFIIVENKHKLLNPIVSRFCEIYVPEHIVDGKIVNLHQYTLEQNMNLTDYKAANAKWVREYLDQSHVSTNRMCSDVSVALYENGFSCIDLMNYIARSDKWDEYNKANVQMCFNKIKSEFRCEKMLMMYMLNFVFLRENTDLHEISFM
jgi:DNA polymerase III delta prime subunit